MVIDVVLPAVLCPEKMLEDGGEREVGASKEGMDVDRRSARPHENVERCEYEVGLWTACI